MRHRFLLGILLTALLFAGGCWELVDINDTAVVTGIGLDRNEQGEVNFSVQLPKAKSPGQTGLSQPESIVNTSTGITSSMAARNSLLYLPRLPLWSHSSVLVVGEQLARSDLAVAADYLARSRVIRKEQTVLIAAGTTADQVLQAPRPLSP
jgi:spore germination protein KC